MTTTRMFLCAAGAAAIAWALPAMADVKAGVDAWSAGDYEAAVSEWRGPAASGDPDAQFNLAQAYRLGRGVAADAREAEALYARAAAHGHLKAADNYGLMLFQGGKREEAMPYVIAAADRGDPRAQYLMGIAHFNGDLAARDWERAYALVTLANAAGLPQAAAAIRQMDSHIPREQREMAQQLAQVMKQNSDALRAAKLAAVDLGFDAAEPAPANLAAVSPAPARTVPAAVPPKAAATKPASGPWKVQLGAFAVDGNAQKLWQKLASRSELQGRQRLLVPSGRVTTLLAGGYASRSDASDACASLKRTGQDCLVTR